MILVLTLTLYSILLPFLNLLLSKLICQILPTLQSDQSINTLLYRLMNSTQALLNLFYSKSARKTFLLGDFNINLLNMSTDPKVSSFLSNLGSHLILPNILLPTRITDNSMTLIDNIFSSISGFLTHHQLNQEQDRVTAKQQNVREKKRKNLNCTDVRSVKKDDLHCTLEKQRQERNTSLYLQARCAKSALKTITLAATATM